MRTTATQYGVVCPPLIKWLLSREPEVIKHLQGFAEDAKPDEVDVAGPPDAIEMALAKRKGVTPALPTIRLFMRKGRHSTTGAPYIEVACSDEHLVELSLWQARRATMSPANH